MGCPQSPSQAPSSPLNHLSPGEACLESLGTCLRQWLPGRLAWKAPRSEWEPEHG